MLTVVRGVGTETADAVQKEYPTPGALLAACRDAGSEAAAVQLLAGIRLGMGGR